MAKKEALARVKIDKLLEAAGWWFADSPEGKANILLEPSVKIKTFKSMTYPYRNHCGRHLLRMSLICGIINFELQRK